MIYEGVKWRRVLVAGNDDEIPEATTRSNVVSGYCELDDEEIQINILSPRACRRQSARHDSYLQPSDSDVTDEGSGLNIQPQEEARMSDLQDNQPQESSRRSCTSSSIRVSGGGKCQKNW